MKPDKMWAATKQASELLGRSPDYLKRLRDSHGGFLEEGIHYYVAPSQNAPICWNVELIREALHERGMEKIKLRRSIELK